MGVIYVRLELHYTDPSFKNHIDYNSAHVYNLSVVMRITKASITYLWETLVSESSITALVQETSATELQLYIDLLHINSRPVSSPDEIFPRLLLEADSSIFRMHVHFCNAISLSKRRAFAIDEHTTTTPHSSAISESTVDSPWIRTTGVCSRDVRKGNEVLLIPGVRVPWQFAARGICGTLSVRSLWRMLWMGNGGEKQTSLTI